MTYIMTGLRASFTVLVTFTLVFSSFGNPSYLSGHIKEEGGFENKDSIKQIHHIVKREKEVVDLATSAAIGGAVGGPVGALLGLIGCWIFCDDAKSEEPNKFPQFTRCNDNGVFYADEKKTTRVVTWSEPTARDPEDGDIAVENHGLKSGNEFQRGVTTIVYTATDSKGATAICRFTIEVKVIACVPLPWPENGFAELQSQTSEYIYGSYYRIGCFDGYEMNPFSPNNKMLIKCSVTTNMQPERQPSTIPSCDIITCPANSTAIKPANGEPVCTKENRYDSTCVTRCKNGYSLPNVFQFSNCREDKTWNPTLSNCTDTEPPRFLTCPSTIYAFADRSSNTKNITWPIPVAEDNSGFQAVTQTMGPLLGSSFPLGLTEVRYIATDMDENQSPSCIFFVSVDVRCDPPYITDKYLTYECPNGYTYGSTCNLKCMGSFPLIGNETITCEINDTFNPPEGYWDMGESIPYCLKNPCEKLPAPENGAMSCAAWLFGQQCQMQCSNNYDIPYGTVGSDGSPFTGLFTCSASSGVYSPSNTVPGCTRLVTPGQTRVLGEFFYYTGDCSDPSVLNDIKKNFINEMQFLEVNGYGGVCPNQIECNVNNTEVTCGSISGRRKRDTSIEKRSTHEIRVLITIVTTWFDFNSTGADTLNYIDQVQKDMFNVIKASVSNGSLTVRGLTPDQNSFQLGYSMIDCPEGFHVRWSSITCVPCAAGSYLDKSNPMYPGCRDCPIGTYKDKEEYATCMHCPNGTSTLGTGSTNSTECLRKCETGEYSKTGLEPCKPCPKSSYQSGVMSTSCQLCPAGKTTPYGRGTSVNNCTDFDVFFTKKEDSIEFLANEIHSTEITLLAWLKVPSVRANFTILRSESSSMLLQIDYGEELQITINSDSISTGIHLTPEKWIHLVVQIETTNFSINVFINGKMSLKKLVSLSVPKGSFLMEMLSTFKVEMQETSVTGYSLSGYNVRPSLISPAEIAQFASGCSSSSETSFLSMENFKNATINGAKTIVPSKCDNIDQCDPNPCNGHVCKDDINGYRCSCLDGYQGAHCEIAPDYCVDKPCRNNATCHNAKDGNFTCSCPEGYRGRTCEIQIVNGGWSTWGMFTECSATCGGGFQSRSRICNSPPPDPDGIPCNASQKSETVQCNTIDCPECSQLQRSFGNVLSCEESMDGHTICTVSCRSGYVFLPGNLPQNEYVCGPNSSYQWKKEPPACGRAYSPRSISTTSVINYTPFINCDQASEASQALQNKVESAVHCKLNNACTVNVETPECSKKRRRRRSSSSGYQVLTLSQTLQAGDNLDLEMYEKTGNKSSSLSDLLNGVGSLEASIQQLNETHSILQFLLNGINYTSYSIVTTAGVGCTAGQGRTTVFCVECPVGTYSSSGICQLCDIGTYQNEAGQITCKQCPVGYSTEFQGSANISDCSENSTVSTTAAESTMVSKTNVTETSSEEITTDIINSSSSVSYDITSVTHPFSNRKHNQKDDIKKIAVVCAILAFCLVVAILSSICIYKKIMRSQFRNQQIVTGSWASLSMVKPDLLEVMTPKMSSAMPGNPKFDLAVLKTKKSDINQDSVESIKSEKNI